MVIFEAVAGSEEPIVFDQTYYIFHRPGPGKVCWPKAYSRTTAKSLFTRKFDHWVEKDRSLILGTSYIYKLVDQEWVCIFNPDSPAGHEYIEGRLTQRELRDTIDW